MSSKTSPQFTSAIHPPIGTLIDGGSLELVEVLGVGGYGVVYRAIEARNPAGPKSYAVKCLVASGHQTPRQRQIHIREIALHQLASAHPGVVTLHRVVDQLNCTFIIMDYAPDHDLFTQILHSCRYLGDDALIKDVFIQLLEAVEYCHSLGIYHRDLKPENILCFEDGLKVAVTDFGLATSDKLSDEFRTGSVYHMSPECQGGEFAPTGHYSPRANDVWSLGIILLNLATGRNPWKSATAGDPTFQAYLRDPMGFLPSVLPISQEVNEILVRMLEVDWRQRISLRDVRYAIEEVTTFYSEGAVLEGSMARCPWEAGMEIDSASSTSSPAEASPVSEHSVPCFPQDVEQRLDSHWSKDSASDLEFAPRSFAAESSYGIPWTTNYSSCGATYNYDSPDSSESDGEQYDMDLFDRTRTPPLSSANTTPASTAPNTPNLADTFPNIAKPEPRLLINTNIPRPRIFDANDTISAYSNDTSIMQTAIEYDPYSSMYFLNSPITADKGVVIVPPSSMTVIGEDKEMTSPSVWTATSTTQISAASLYSTSSPSSSIRDDDLYYERSGSPSPEGVYHPYRTSYEATEQPLGKAAQVQSQISPSHSIGSSVTDFSSPSRPSNIMFPTTDDDDKWDPRQQLSYRQQPGPQSAGGKPKTLRRFSLKFFSRPSSPSASPPSPATPVPHGRAIVDPPRPTTARGQTPAATPQQVPWCAEDTRAETSAAAKTRVFVRQQQDGVSTTRCRGRNNARRSTINTPRGSANAGGSRQQQQHSPRSKSPKHWFIPGRFRISTGVN
ncbi:hypothetical protein CVT24_005120 [Panaeolus cyanescens]|uniref:non-specific serine/threonine protein kinase n=1 Tax=Panaeolus cyanescens TaxID=181874 RepID=A0A409W2B0_9AGAR|nr:hypothetical protein CVT24_005120 [Panaeolus cyanescens]